MPQVFRLQIAYPDGDVVDIPAGGPIEINLIEECTNAIVAKGVGFFKTEAAVRDAVRQGLHEALLALKRRSVEAM